MESYGIDFRLSMSIAKENTEAEVRNIPNSIGVFLGESRNALMENLVTGLKNCFVKIRSQGTVIEAWKSL
jgi:hypothetical protein